MRIGSYAYDARGREVERATFPASYHSATTRPPLSAATSVSSTRWHATFNLPTQRAEPGRISAWSYSAKGLPTGSSWTATTDGTGAAKFSAGKTGSTYATGYSYNAAGLVSTVVERETPVGGVAVESGRWTFKHNAAGHLTSAQERHSGLKVSVSGADAHGRVTQATDAAGNPYAATYLPRGQTRSESYLGLTMNYSYDAFGSLVEAALQNGGPTATFTYDAAHRRTGYRITYPSTTLPSVEAPTSKQLTMSTNVATSVSASAATPIGLPSLPGIRIGGGGWIGWGVGLIFGLRDSIPKPTPQDRCERQCDADYDMDKAMCEAAWKMHGRNNDIYRVCTRRATDRYIQCYQDCAETDKCNSEPR